MVMKYFAAASICISAFAAAPAVATTITFNSETTGAKPNGYTVGGVTFSDTSGADLQVLNSSETNSSNGLYVFSDDASALRMLFATLSTDLSMNFGNDEVCVPGNCPFGADRALLEILLGGTVVGSTFVLFNQNNVDDQTIGINGIAFDEARLTYTNSSFQAANLIEAVDNITFNAAAVPEPSTWAMMLLGFGGIGFSMRRRTAGARLAQDLA